MCNYNYVYYCCIIDSVTSAPPSFNDSPLVFSPVFVLVSLLLFGLYPLVLTAAGESGRCARSPVTSSQQICSPLVLLSVFTGFQSPAAEHSMGQLSQVQTTSREDSEGSEPAAPNEAQWPHCCQPIRGEPSCQLSLCHTLPGGRCVASEIKDGSSSNNRKFGVKHQTFWTKPVLDQLNQLIFYN